MAFGDEDFEFQLPEIGETIGQNDKLADAVKDVLTKDLDDAIAKISSDYREFNNAVAGRQASNRAVTEIQIAAVERTINNNLQTIFDNNQQQATDILGAITDTAIGQIELTDAAIKHSEERIGNKIANNTLEVVGGLLEIEQAVNDKIEAQSSEVRQNLGTVTDIITKDIDSLARAGKDNLSNAESKIIGEIEGNVGAVGKAVLGAEKSIIDSVERGIASIGASVGSIIGDFGSGIAELGGSLVDLGNTVVDGIGTTLADLLSPFWDQFLIAAGVKTENDAITPGLGADKVINAIDPGSSVIMDEWRKIESSNPSSPILTALMNIALTLFVRPIIVAKMLDKRGDKMLQAYGVQAPWALLPVPDIIDAWRRGLKGVESALLEIRSQGYTDADAQIAMALRKAIAPVGTQIEWLLRGFISQDRFREELKGVGYEDRDIDRFIEGSEVIPGIQDLITMAVREVFTPELSAELGLFEDYPSELTEYAQKQGLNEGWARNYWAAHWQLPSPHQAAEMLHRGVIDDKLYEKYLRAADYSPFWRDKLQAISYSPVTRVDLRRMYEIGVATESDLVQGYKDLGYTQQNAEKLTEFAVMERAKAKADYDSQYRGLTNAMLRAAYRKELISLTDVMLELEKRQFTPTAAKIYLEL